jgi:V/A-type H+-transporting ATPase subunit I
VGLLFAILILLFGHAINLALCIMSGVVHGLRLNVIEFFKWGLSAEGRPFHAYAKKEAD